jgi:2-methylcitrate dehydratase
LIDGKVTDQQFQPSRFTDPAIWKFLENVKVMRNAELSSLYPGAVANIVHVALKDGRTLTKRVDYPLGNAKNPVSDVELERKFLHLVAPALGRDHSAKILQHAWLLDQEKGVHHLMKSLKMP